MKPPAPDISEDRRRLDEFKRTGLAVPLDEVKAWVASWGPQTSCLAHSRARSDDAPSPDATLDGELQIRNTFGVITGQARP